MTKDFLKYSSHSYLRKILLSKVIYFHIRGEESHS
jgi:hypothetical protein